jgi:multidrug efflux pump subunit AcrB
MNSEFFINRPRFAIVISLFLTILGLLAFMTLNYEKFPEATPTQISVTLTYPGASADVVESSVATILEYHQSSLMKRTTYQSCISKPLCNKFGISLVTFQTILVSQTIIHTSLAYNG